MSEHSQERPSPGLEKFASAARDYLLAKPHNINPLVVIEKIVEGQSITNVRHLYDLLIINHVSVTLNGQLQGLRLSPLEVSKLFLQAYLARELLTDEEVHAKVLAGPYAGVLPAPATT